MSSKQKRRPSKVPVQFKLWLECKLQQDEQDVEQWIEDSLQACDRLILVGLVHSMRLGEAKALSRKTRPSNSLNEIRGSSGFLLGLQETVEEGPNQFAGSRAANSLGIVQQCLRPRADMKDKTRVQRSKM